MANNMLKRNNLKIPKGYRRVRLGEILPPKHMFYDEVDNKWYLDGEKHDIMAGTRLGGYTEICITKK